MKYYYTDKNRNEAVTKVVRAFEDNGKFYAELEDSLYYPQGGGQKGDRGTIKVNGEEFQVVSTVKDEHYNSIVVLDHKLEVEGAEAECTLNREFRDRQMRAHTALHLIHCAIEKVLGHELEYPTMSLIEDGYAVNKYNDTAFDMGLVDEAVEVFNGWIAEDLPVETYADEKDENYRFWKCMDYVIPCGGIHVDHLKQIGEVKVSVTHKKKATSVRIDLL